MIATARSLWSELRVSDSAAAELGSRRKAWFKRGVDHAFVILDPGDERPLGVEELDVGHGAMRGRPG